MEEPAYVNTSAIGSEPGIGVTEKIAGEGFKREWPPLIKMDAAVRMRIDALMGNNPHRPS